MEVAASVLDWVGLGMLARGRTPLGIREELVAAGAAADRVGRLQFNTQGFSTAVNAAKAEHKFLVVVLFSPDHADAGKYAQQLTDDAVVDALASEFILWGASVLTPQGKEAALSLGVMRYPYLGILYAHQPPRTIVLKAVEGFKTADALLEELRLCQETAGALLVTQRADRMESEARRRLQEEQEAALLEAERIDGENARLQEEKEQREREERELAEEAEREAAEEARLEAQREEDRLAQLFARKDEALRCLGPEPPEDTPKEDLIKLRVTMLDGTPCDRRFLKTDTVRKVVDFVTTHPSFDGKKRFAISTTYPVKVLSEDMSLGDAGLYPRAAVLAKELFD